MAVPCQDLERQHPLLAAQWDWRSMAGSLAAGGLWRVLRSRLLGEEQAEMVWSWAFFWLHFSWRCVGTCLDLWTYRFMLGLSGWEFWRSVKGGQLWAARFALHLEFDREASGVMTWFGSTFLGPGDSCLHYLVSLIKDVSEIVIFKYRFLCSSNIRSYLPFLHLCFAMLYHCYPFSVG